MPFDIPAACHLDASHAVNLVSRLSTDYRRDCNVMFSIHVLPSLEWLAGVELVDRRSFMLSEAVHQAFDRRIDCKC